MEQLTYSEKKGSHYVIYELGGGLTFSTIDVFRTSLYEKVAETNVALGLSQITEIDSTGVGVIFAANGYAKEYSHNFYLLNPSGEVLRSLVSTGLYDLLEVVTSTTEII